jgi:hypothetical protein
MKNFYKIRENIQWRGINLIDFPYMIIPIMNKQFVFLFLRILIAAVLLTAAGLKAQELLVMPKLEYGLLDAKWLNQFAVLLELSLGIWLLSGLLQKTLWLVTLCLFVGFAGILLYEAAILSRTNCGCFGAVQVNPWITMTLDLVIVGLLAIFRPNGMIFHRQTFFQEISGLKLSKRFFVTVGIWLIVALPITYAMMSVKFVTLTPDSVLTGHEKSITLEPMNWMGKDFPLFEHIVWEGNVSLDELKSGDWKVLLYHVDCQNCQEVLAELEMQSRRQSFEKLIILEIPGKERESRDAHKKPSYGKWGRLRDQTEWFVQTPLVLELKNGQVSIVDTKNFFLSISNKS